MLTDGERIMYNISTSELTPLPVYTNLIESNTFDESNVFASNPEGVPSAWGCFNAANDNVLGVFGLVTEDGRPSLHYARGGGSVAHGETGCSLAFTSDGRPGVDVSPYSYISFEVTFKIQNQSLSGCGQDGSECPMMLQLDYIPVGQQEAVRWHHGFYVWNSQPTFPPRCLTCTEEHEVVNGGAWYTYRSENLLALIPPVNHPDRLLALRVYSSGHEYDVYVNETSLYASEQIDPVPVGDPSLQG
jgi:hypothetical protein